MIAIMFCIDCLLYLVIIKCNSSSYFLILAVLLANLDNLIIAQKNAWLSNIFFYCNSKYMYVA